MDDRSELGKERSLLDRFPRRTKDGHFRISVERTITRRTVTHALA